MRETPATPRCIHDTPLGGGTDGIYLSAKPVLGAWLDLSLQAGGLRDLRRPGRAGIASVALLPRGLVALNGVSQVLLLDEPLAGMGAEETERMLALLAELKSSHAILLVEHDMDAVFRIADCITVMVNGADVRVAYLGEH